MIRFFYPQEEEHNKAKKEKKLNPLDLVPYLRDTDISVILFRKNIFNSKQLKMIIDGYNTTLGFYYTTLSDPRFDVLTPPPKLYDEYPIGLEIELFDDRFSISSPRSPNRKMCCEYKPNTYPLLSCLETNKLTKELCEVIKTFKHSSDPIIEQGTIICRCTDYRFPQIITKILLLTATQPLLQYYNERQKNGTNLLKNEKNLLLQHRPFICTDPSHNVSRINHIIDWRQKMWINRNERNNEPSQHDHHISPARANVEKPTVRANRIPLRKTHIEFPTELLNMVAGMSNDSTAMSL
ncbi:uncharacterized protein GO595_000316 [Histomonas meleagridis]|uniref:uncharacterized protein n=1 Tax=Histomonas meleagridis TaxID=135588 RepID=UPI00355ACDA6|nr:hypothetical protein GO595_000316 [Histomonas meleagridis]